MIVIISACIFPMACSSNNGQSNSSEANNTRKYTVTFDARGGTECTPYTTVNGEVSWLPTPTQDGYEFLGWFRNLKNENSFKLGTVISENTKLIAKWAKYVDEECSYGIQSDGTYIIDGCNYDGLEAIILPEEHNGISVTAIGAAAFAGCNLYSIKLPDSISKIGDNAFENCTASYINIPNHTEKIGNKAFMGCEKLVNISISSWVREIGYSAFYGCKKLEMLFMDNVETIGHDAFAYCTNLKKAYIGAHCDVMGSGVFLGCKKLGIVYCGYKSKPSRWESNWKNNGIGSIIWGCDNWGWGDLVRELENGEIEYVAKMYNSDGGTSVPDEVWGKTVTSVADNAYWACDKIERLEIPDTIKKIGLNAFRGCSSIREIYIPASVTTISDYAFADCTSLKTIYCEVSYEPYAWSSNWNYGCDAKVVWGYVKED